MSKTPIFRFIKVTSKPTPDRMMPAVVMLLLRCRLTANPIARPMILTRKPAYGTGQKKMARTPNTKDAVSKHFSRSRILDKLYTGAYALCHRPIRW